MNIIVGATGQVGSLLTAALKNKDVPFTAVVRNPDKLPKTEIQARKADLFDRTQLTAAFQGGSTAFLLTPENPASADIIGDTGRIVENYSAAIRSAGIRRVIALSCIGAQETGQTGNVLMSRMLEQSLDDLDLEKIYVRPSYYYSNWLAYLETVKTQGVLPSFFPEDLELEMNAPDDLAGFIADLIAAPPSEAKDHPSGTKSVYELGGHRYSSREIAESFAKLLHRKVAVQTVPPHQWKETLLAFGFTESTAGNLSDMTRAVIDKRLVPEFPERLTRLPTTFEAYLHRQLASGIRGPEVV